MLLCIFPQVIDRDPSQMIHSFPVPAGRKTEQGKL